MEQKVKFISPNSGEECKPAHYLAELSITRKASKSGQSLPFKFWNTTAWKRDYKLAIMSAHSLLKLFDIKLILAALNSTDGKWIYSLGYHGLVDLIARERDKQEFEDKQAQLKTPIIHNSDDISHVPVQQTKKSIINQLD